MNFLRLKARKFQPYLWLVCLLSILFCLDFFRVIDFREREAIDLRFRLRGERPANEAVTLVEIDDSSLKTFGQWPWPRGLHGRFLEGLKAHPPAAVFFDILFTEASPDPAQDQALASGLHQLNKTILPFYYTSAEPFEAFFPLPVLEQAVQTTGFVNVEPDTDGVTRRVRTMIQGDGKIYYNPALLMAALKEQGRSGAAAELLKSLPGDSRTSFWINYPGTASSYRRISFQDAMRLMSQNDAVQLDEFFKNRVVIIGHTATGTTDLRPSPFSAADLGLSIQAAAIHTILSRDFLHASPAGLNGLILLLFGIALFEIVTRLRNRYGFLATAGSAALYLVCNFLLFVKAGWIFPVETPLIAMAAAAFLAFLVKYLQIQMQTELLERELQMAAKIQDTFLPRLDQARRGPFDLAWDYQFAKEVGGDLFDWVALDENRWGLVIGDVSGKGVPAALFMAKAISEFRREDKGGCSPSDLCKALNRACLSDGATGLFLTLIYAVLDPVHQRMDFAVAGHEPMIYYQHESQKTVLIGTEGGPPLGLFEEADYSSESIRFYPGDFILLITDGVRELRDPEGEEFGMDRLRALLEKYGREKLSADTMIQNLRREWTLFQGDAPDHDDRTVICLKFPESPELLMEEPK